MRIVYIDIDSARPDHFGCYGYERDTTPRMDEVASAGVRFTNCYASDTPCLPSRTALFSGSFGINNGVVNHGGSTADLAPDGASREFVSRRALDSLAERLRGAGVHTASITPFPHRHSAYHIWYGFHETYDTGGNGLEPANMIVPYVDDWLRRRGSEDDWFLHVNFWDPHTPYDTPLEFGNPFADAPPPVWMTQEIIDAQRQSYGTRDAVTPYPAVSRWPNIANEYGGEFTWPRGVATIRNLEDFKSWIDGYDCGLAFADLWIGKILDRLRELGVYDETAIIISADHGEDLGELNQYGDHRCADHLTANIPLIVKWPGVTDHAAGAVSDAFVYNIDLAHTLVDLVGGTVPESWDGQPFSGLLRDPSATGRDHLVLSQATSCIQRSARWDEFIFVRTYHNGFNDWPTYMLFDVAADPHETVNLAGDRMDLVEHGVRLIDDFVGFHLMRGIRQDPLFQVMQEGGPHHARDIETLCELLRQTGREEHARWIEVNGGRPRALV